MHLMLLENWMEGQCVALKCVWSYPLERSAPGAVAPLHPGIDALGIILGDVALKQDEDHQGGGRQAAVAAGLFQETSADIGLSPKTRTVSVQNPSHDQEVVLGLPKGSDHNLWLI